MTAPAILLLLLSAAVHAGWNFFSKRTEPSAAFFLVSTVLSNLITLPVLVIFAPALSAFTPTIWGLLALTGALQSLYLTALALAYRNGDLSLAYPLVRAAPVALLAALKLLLGLQEVFTPLALVGMALIVLGSLLLPVRRLADWHVRDYLRRPVAWALLAACGTAGYSLVDDYALRLLRQTPDLAVSSTGVTLVYASLEGLAIGLGMLVIVLVWPEQRRALLGYRRERLSQAALAGLGMLIAYSLVLIAMGLARDVSYIVAFRQTSILLGALLGVVALHEKPSPPKLAGVGLLFVGLVCVALG